MDLGQEQLNVSWWKVCDYTIIQTADTPDTADTNMLLAERLTFQVFPNLDFLYCSMVQQLQWGQQMWARPSSWTITENGSREVKDILTCSDHHCTGNWNPAFRLLLNKTGSASILQPLGHLSVYDHLKSVTTRSMSFGVSVGNWKWEEALPFISACHFVVSFCYL